DDGHNFNLASREVVYAHFHQFMLGLSQEDSRGFHEPPYAMDPVEALRVFPGEGTPEGLADENAVLASLRALSQEKWVAQLPKTYTDRPAFRSRHAGALGDAFG